MTRTFLFLIGMTLSLLGGQVSAADFRFSSYVNYDFLSGDLLEDYVIVTQETGIERVEEITAGRGTYIGMSMGMRYGPMLIRTNIGYKITIVGANNGKSTFERIPVEVIASYALKLAPYSLSRHYLGLGATKHFKPTYECTIDNYCDFTVPFSSTVGVVAEYQYEIDFPRDQASLGTGIRYTLIQYRLSNPAALFSGNTLGIFLSYNF